MSGPTDEGTVFSMGEPVPGCPCRQFGAGPPAVLLVPSPPFVGAVFDVVARRLARHVTVWVPEVLALLPGAASPDRLACRLAPLLAQGGPVLVYGHLLSVPIVRCLPAHSDPAALVLSNGPLDRLDPLLATWAGLARLPGGVGLLEKLLLRPGLLLRWLASSAGLRRSVVNPYVMEAAEVERLVHAAVADPAARHALAVYLKNLGAGGLHAATFAGPVHTLWGDADPLYPLASVAAAVAGRHHGMDVVVPGGRLLFAAERPWYLADALLDMLPPGVFPAATLT